MPDPHLVIAQAARLTLWLVVLAVVFVPLERLFALHPRKALRAGVAADVGFYFLNSLAPALVLALPLAALSAVLTRAAPAYYAGAAALPLWLQLAAAFVIGEIGFYWGHRWTHEWPAMWRFHKVHHSPEGMDWLVNTRAHPVDSIFTRLCGLAPITLLGLARPDTRGSIAAGLVVIAGTFWGFVIHANLRWRLGPLEHLLSSPRFHHWHHVRTGPIDRNYASMLPVLDRLFGTHHLPPRAWPDRYGIAKEGEER